ncbi:MAG: hypothetical protein ACKOUM_02950 [Sphingopyxis sp.]
MRSFHHLLSTLQPHLMVVALAVINIAMLAALAVTTWSGPTAV